MSGYVVDEKWEELRARESKLRDLERSLIEREATIRVSEAELQEKWDKLTEATELQVKELTELSYELDVVKLRKRLHTKSSKIEELRLELNMYQGVKSEEGAESLYKECTRLTNEMIKINADKVKAEDALSVVCKRYNLDVELDFYKGIPVWATTDETIEIPEGGMILEFLDEECTITRDHFGGMDLIHFELFAATVNDELKPERWRVGLRDGQVTLFARGLYKVTDIELVKPEFSEPEIKIEQVGGQVQDVQ